MTLTILLTMSKCNIDNSEAEVMAILTTPFHVFFQ